MSRWIELLLSLLIWGATASSSSTPSFSTREVRHLELLSSFTLSSGGVMNDLSSHPHRSSSRHAVMTSSQHTAMNMNGLNVPHGEAIHLEFEAMNQHFSYHMQAMTGLVAADGGVDVMSSDGTITRHPFELRSYYTDLDDEWASITIHSDGTFHGIIRRNGEVYQIDHADVHQDAMHTTEQYHTFHQQAIQQHAMTIFKHSDVIQDDHQCGAIPSDSDEQHHYADQTSTNQQELTHTHQRSLKAIEKWDCGFKVNTPSGLGAFSTGIAVDYGMYLRLGSSSSRVQEYVQGLYSTMNAVYNQQLSTMLVINRILIMNSPGKGTTNAAWNIQPTKSGRRCDVNGGLVGGGSVTAGQTLSNFRAWVSREHGNEYTLWHQLTNCFPPGGTVGIAYIGTLCKYSRTGVTTYTSTTWLTMAHEIGHNMDMQHTFQLGQGKTGGIMDYGKGKGLLGDYKFNIKYSKSEFCAEVKRIRADPTGVRSIRNNGGIKPYCWAPYQGTRPTTKPVPTTKPPTTRPTAAPITYRWLQGGYGSCSSTCEGIATQTVRCVSSTNPAAPVTVPDSRCANAGTKPSSTRSCGGKCPLQFVSSTDPNAPVRDCVSSNGARCSNNNRRGTQANPTQCVKRKDGQVIVVADRECTSAGIRKPATSITCDLPKCSTQYTWAYSGYGECSKECGGGQQQRLVVCVSSANGAGAITRVNDNNCVASTKPAAIRPCMTQPCLTAGERYEWILTSNWTSCSASCGGGIQTRTAYCHDRLTGSQAVGIIESLCPNQPQLRRTCNIQPCPEYRWFIGQTGTCDVTCGTGTATVDVYCADQTQPTPRTRVNNALCNALPKPSTTTTCALAPCPAKPGSGFPIAVGSGEYRWWYDYVGVTCTPSCRVVSLGDALCIDVSDGTYFVPIASSYCSQLTPPALDPKQPQIGKACVNDPMYQNRCSTQKQSIRTSAAEKTDVPVWQTIPAGNCSHVCDGGVQPVTVTCVGSITGTTLPTTSCNATEKPQDTIECATQPCRAIWVAQEWEQCSEECGAAGTQSRVVECKSSSDIDGPALDEARCWSAPKPSTTTSCNIRPCPQWKVTSDWSECRVTDGLLCGSGLRTRNISCVDDQDVEVDDSSCESQMPAISQECTEPCPTYDTTAWSECMLLSQGATCGNGTRSRSLQCRLPGHEVHAGELASSTAPCDAIYNSSSIPLEQSCYIPCSDSIWSYTTSPCSATCGGGISQLRDIQCINRVTRESVDDSLCEMVEPKPTGTRSCNTQSCGTFHTWVTGSFGECNVECGTGIRTRDLQCIDAVNGTLVDFKLCQGQKRPALSEPCNIPEAICYGYGNNTNINTNTGVRNGMCNRARGECQCRSGYGGKYCTENPSIVSVQLPVARYPQGIPLGERITISWSTTSSSAVTHVDILLEQSSSRGYGRPFATRYIARRIINTGSFDWIVGSMIRDLEYGNAYNIRVWYRQGISNVSAEFIIADSCQYTACGAHGRCMMGTCICQGGYTGPTCAISPCDACNDEHSTCNPNAATPTCTCKDGWTGTLCNTPPGCSAKCEHGGDYPLVDDTDLDTTDVINVTTTTGTCPLSPDTACACRDGWSGLTCSTCGLTCLNGGRADSSCTSCECPRGRFGPTCSCRYYEISFALAMNNTFVTDVISVYRFNATLANDLARGLPISSQQIVITSLKAITGGGVAVTLQFRSRCDITSRDAITFSRQTQSQWAADDTETSDEDGNDLFTLYDTFREEVNNRDSITLNGILTSALQSGSIIVTDPTGANVQQPNAARDPFDQQDGDGTPAAADPSTTTTGESSTLNTSMLAIIAGAGATFLVVVIVIVMVIRRHRRAKDTVGRVANAWEPTSTATPTHV